MKQQDLLLDQNFDLRIDHADYVLGESTEQQQQLLLACKKGDFRENPTTCVGSAGYLKDNDYSKLCAEIKTQFEKDGMTIKTLKPVNSSNINIDAAYE